MVDGCSGATGWCPRQGSKPRSPASGHSLGCSELCIRALGVSGDASHPARREQARLQNVVHQKKNNHGFLLGTGCPLEGSLRHGTKQKAGACRPPRPLSGVAAGRGRGSCSLRPRSGFADHLGQPVPSPR